MAKVVIYTTAICPYCVQAKHLLTDKGAEYEEVDVTSNHEIRQEMMEKSGGKRTVPQIFINDKSIGGFDELYRLDTEGKLDDLLK